ncbi:MAG: ABC-F family ATP-binding cassette domain-containing protein, partial [Anaerolineaceae bacterium]
EDPTEGTVQRARNVQVGYLPQEAHFLTNHTLWEECLTAFAELQAMQMELTRLETRMSDPDQAEAALESYCRLQHEFELQGGYTYETRIRQTLTGLGFAPEDAQRPLDQLSGGQRTRALLARLLLENPDLLLLDEPTNHLDLFAVEWLEAYLKDWEGAVLIVSHDRYFLDQVAQTIWEMTPAMEEYRGNYTAYLTQRAERYTRRLEEYQAQAEFVEKEEEYIRRNLAGQNTKQAQGRRKRLERMLEEARLTPPREQRHIHMQLQPVARSGDLVVRTYGLSVGYEDEGRPLFSVPDLTLLRGECAAIIGPNGAGKTTFLKTLLDQVPPYAGEVALGSSLKIGYFAQAHEDLKPERTLMEEIHAVAPNLLPAAVRDYLAKFLFSGDDVFKLVSVLSGGERGRLALAKLALGGANLLLLDEPTNHLDLPSQEILQTILSGYAGTILLVSHDRYLIDALGTQIWEVLPQESAMRVFEGTYSEYRAVKEAEAAERAAQKAAESQARRSTAQQERGRNNHSSAAERKRKQRLQSVEDEIAALEEKMKLTERQLENPPGDPQKVYILGQDYVRLQKSLESLMEEWADLADD